MASGGQHTPQNGKGSVDVQGKSRVVFSLNMFRHVLVVIIVVANLSSVELCAGPIGLERMERFDLLPVLNTSIGSLYSVEMIMDLKSNQWSAVRENIPGNGRDMIIPADLTVTNGFYRFKVIR